MIVTLKNPTNGEQHAVDDATLVPPADAPEGWTSGYEGWEQIAEGLPLEDLQADKIKSVKLQATSRLRKGFSYDFGGTVHTLDFRDADDKANWTNLRLEAQELLEAGDTKTKLIIRTAANEEVVVTPPVAYDAMVQMREWEMDTMKHKWKLEKAAKKATANKLETIDPEEGWPS